MMVIYLITNTIDGKTYVGKTKDLEARWERHLKNVRYNDTWLYRAIRKHGKENFTIQTIAECGEAAVDNAERYFIAELNPEYNMTAGGTGGDTSHTPGYIRGMENRQDNSGEKNPMFGRKRYDQIDKNDGKKNSEYKTNWWASPAGLAQKQKHKRAWAIAGGNMKEAQRILKQWKQGGETDERQTNTLERILQAPDDS